MNYILLTVVDFSQKQAIAPFSKYENREAIALEEKTEEMRSPLVH
ncbi:hypothetical protein [Nostoc sp. UHCC 0870]|nr:hypothetical protein [Nostoc sp. UHCC 0870]